MSKVKGFIEVTITYNQSKELININKITAVKSNEIILEKVYIEVEESYEVIKQLIIEAQTN